MDAEKETTKFTTFIQRGLLLNQRFIHLAICQCSLGKLRSRESEGIKAKHIQTLTNV